MTSITYIDENRVKSLLNWEITVDAVEKALSASTNGRSRQTQRSATPCLNNENDVLLTMPGHFSDSNYGALCCKLVTIFQNNVKKNMPNILANIILFDEDTGAMKAVIAATEITAWRTAAASIVATKYLHLNKPDFNTDILAIYGAGAQGRIHAMAFQYFFNFKEVRIWNRTKANAEQLVNELNCSTDNSGIFKCYTNIEDCASNADVIITATSSTEPLIKLNHLKKNVHINAVGAGMENLIELDYDVYRNSQLYCDYLYGTRSEFPIFEKHGIEFSNEIGAVINGKIKLANDKNQITVFQSIGMAVEDCAMARLIYDQHMTK